MKKNNITSARLTSMLLLAVLIAGCGEWVDYDGTTRGGAGFAGVEVGAFPEDGALSHEALSGLMSRYLSTSADKKYVLLDYDSILKTEDRYQLKAILFMAAEVDPSKLKDKDERLAFWINGYNAAVIAGVLSEYAGSAGYKVTDSGTFFDSGTTSFGGVALTHNQIENGVIRGQWDNKSLDSASDEALARMKTWHQELWGGGKIDARFHAAVNCAALGCPNLLADAPYVYRAATLDAQLEKATKAWLDNPDKGAGASGISKLFDWYKADFVADAGSVEAFIKAHRTGGAAGVKLGAFLSYDWTLNHKANKK